jgi:formylmethanofuran dehydrogenase subunit B
MICPFCSLLCDAENLDAIQCVRRTASLVRFANLSETDESVYEDWVYEAIESLRRAKRILVMGRIASVESARAVVAFASKHNATIDCAESGHVFKNVLAIQRSGLNSVSLAEARDHSDFLMVIGDDSMMAAVPRMPFALSNGRPGQQTALLLGDFSIAATEQWKKAGFDTWSVRCELATIPSSLAQWSRWSDSTASKPSNEASPTNQLFERMATARYTTVVWSAETLQLEQADLWVERMLQWISSRNEDTRCAALPWTSLDGTFQQVCTWLTGFPGRVAFRDGVPDYDPDRHSYEQWIARTPIGKAHESVIVLIDETVA